MVRPTWDEYFIGLVQAAATRATCDRGRSACVFVRDHESLVTGYVGSPKGLPHCDEIGHQLKTVIHEDGSQTTHCRRTVHAEQAAICQAARRGVSLNGATLYVTMTPCPACAKLLANIGVTRVVCERRYHAGAESEEIFEQAGIQLDILHPEDTETYPDQ